ncbi:MAG: anaerobic sulfatase maturase [Eubacterium sp.]
MPAASILIKPASANCNIDCKYCFYKCLSSNRKEYSKGFMSEETLEQLIIQGIDYAENYVSFAFQGGEPTLAGIPFFEKAVELQKKYNTKNLIIENTIQTNGMLIDDEWAEFLAKNHFLVGLSLDGPKKYHDAYRKDVKGLGTFDPVMRTINLFRKHGVDYNILSVITNETARKASYLYKFYKRNQFLFIQLIPCMDEPGRNAVTSDASLNVEEYGKFLCEFFDLWYEDFCQGEQMDIRMFSNLAQMAAGYPAEECGMNGHCTCYFVVEGDGSIYPCDFYCMDQWKLGTVKDSFQSLLSTDKAKSFVEQSNQVSEKCKSCQYFSLCRGGCRRWRETTKGSPLDLNYLCPAYEIFFEHTWGKIGKLGDMIRKKYGEYRK